MNRLLEWLWSLLPDKCQVQDCRRKGVRGNENRVGGYLVCDDCHAFAFAAALGPVLEEPASKKMTVEFAPGCFDNLPDDMTQEEIDELVQEITDTFTNMTPEDYERRCTPVDPDTEAPPKKTRQ